jgi:hypothetical protein
MINSAESVGELSANTTTKGVAAAAAQRHPVSRHLLNRHHSWRLIHNDNSSVDDDAILDNAMIDGFDLTVSVAPRQLEEEEHRLRNGRSEQCITEGS